MANSASSSEVLLLDTWVSVFGMRVRIALAEKAIHYDRIEQDLNNKSPLLLQTNPLHKKIPVLIHNAKPISESNIIVQYIDDAWHNLSPQLLPSDPYLRAQSRFWADFVDKKIFETGRRIWRTKGEQREAAKKEFIELLKVLEGELGEKAYLIGDSFGYADIAFVPFYCWFYSIEKVGNLSIEKECPKLVSWIKRCIERESVSKTLPDSHKVYEYILEVQKTLGTN